MDSFGVTRRKQAPNGKARHLHRTKTTNHLSGSTKMQHWNIAAVTILAECKDLLIRGGMLFPMGVGAGTVMRGTLIALMSSIALGLFHAAAVTGARDARMFPYGSRRSRS